MIPLSQLRETISKRSNAQLVDMVSHPDQYIPEAIQIAKELCCERGLRFSVTESEVASASNTSAILPNPITQMRQAPDQGARSLNRDRLSEMASESVYSTATPPPINARTQIHELAFEVADSLTDFVAVNDIVLKETASWISVLKNIFGRGTTMEHALGMVKPLENKWEDLSRKAESLDTNWRSNMSESESRYFALLTKYIGAVNQAVMLLADRQKLVLAIKRGGGNGPGYDQLLAVQERYREATSRYVAAGNELNSRAHLVAPWPTRWIKS